MSHADARLTEYARLLAASRVARGREPGEVPKQLGVSRQTVYKWVRRLRAQGSARGTPLWWTPLATWSVAIIRSG